MRSQEAKQKNLYANIFTAIETNQDLLGLLSSAATPASIATFILALKKELPGVLGDKSDQPTTIFNELTAWFGKPEMKYYTSFPQLGNSLKVRKGLALQHRNKKIRFIRCIGLDWTLPQKNAFLGGMKSIYLPKLQAPYPPKDHWIVETAEIDAQWRNHLEHGKQPDSRRKRYPLFRMDPTHLQLDIGCEDNILIYDSTSRDLVMVIVHNFCLHPDLLIFIDGIIKQGIEHRKSIRLEDPGKLVQVGLSAGARSKPSVNWVQNILSKKTPANTIDKLDCDTSHIYSLFWMLIRKKLPDEISSDLVSWLANTGIHRMNKDAFYGRADESALGKIELDIAGNAFNFHLAELAPPCGVMAANYSRSVHHESQPHKFAISWTISRTLLPNQGGHFYNCDYGVRVQGSADTIVAWDPSQWHGTSLQDYPPTTQILSDYNQTGLAIVTSNRISQVWEKYMEEKLTLEELDKEWDIPEVE